jgi:PAS domain S-box-containing protein
MADREVARAEDDAAFLVRVIRTLPVPMFVKDRSYRYVVVNDALKSVSGDPTLDLEGRTDFEVFDLAIAEIYRKHDDEVFSGARAVVRDQEFVDARGDRRFLATTKVPLRAADGAVTHLLGLVHDVTDQKRAEESLRTINQALQERVRDRTQELEDTQAALLRKERLAVVGELASALAHQIRNPLGAISNASYVLSRALADHPDPNVSRAIAIVHEEAWRANRIIGDLLDYARIRPAVRTRARPADLVGRAVFALRVPEGVELIEHDLALPRVHVDEEQVVRALANLLRSAAENAAPHGVVSIRGRVEAGSVEIAICDESGGALAGVDAADLLAPPSEPPVPSSPKPLDVALGLATARALVENQGGAVELSPEGARPSFLVRLPLDARQVTDSLPDG